MAHETSSDGLYIDVVPGDLREREEVILQEVKAK